MSVLDKSNSNLTELPYDDPDWNNVVSLSLNNNNIEELDTSKLPPGLEHIDLSDNPLRVINGLFPPTLTHLVLNNTKIGKLSSLPDSIIELEINGTPVSEKYGTSWRPVISDKAAIERMFGKPYEKYETMLDNSPKITNIPVNVPHLNEPHQNAYEQNAREINMTNLGGGALAQSVGGALAQNGGDPRSTTPLVMILDHRETEDDIIYRVQTLNEGEKEVMSQFLQPFEPVYASQVPTLPVQTPSPVYLNSSHGEDIFFEKPVPPGCMYITLHECGISTQLRHYYTIMLAFDDIPKGIKAKLKDPLKYKDELAKEFGFTFHIHYPEAPHPSDRTYLESIKYPFVNFNDTKRFIKSGMFSLDNDNNFTDTSEEEGIDQVAHRYTGSFTNYHLQEMYEGSIFPTYDQVKNLGDINNTYQELNNIMKKFKCTQSWLFKKFPGIHYNFSCRAIFHHNSDNDRIYQRRRKSLEGAEAYINQMSNNAIQSKATREMLERYQDEGVPHMIAKLVNRGINLNEPSEFSELRPLQEAVAFMQKDIVAVLLKAKGIDKSHTDHLLKRGLKYKLSKARTEQEKQELRDTAAEIHKLLHPVRRSKTYAKRKTVRRNTRRGGRFKRQLRLL
jgi:hypothetical protein